MGVETLNLSDGSSMNWVRPDSMSDSEWKELKDFYESNPEEARSVANFNRNADAMRANMKHQALSDFYYSKLDGGDVATQQKLEGLQDDRELSAMFNDIAENGPGASARYMGSEQLMLKVSRKMGGIPGEVKPELKKLDKTPLTLHEAAKMGSSSAVDEFLEKELADGVDEKDSRGITALGYAIGANRLDIVKSLIKKKADAGACDTDGNTGIHYAAGYGRKEVLEHLIGEKGSNVNAKNSDGKTALDVAEKNGQSAAKDVLKKKGAK
jgi:hypothetical protein